MLIYVATLAAVRLRMTRNGSAAPIRSVLIRIALVLVISAAFVALINAYDRPRSEIGRGLPVPALILIVIVLGMQGIARATTFGRHVYAIGGNMEASRLVGLKTRAEIFRVYILMGVLAAVAAVIATARLNAGTSSTGELLELSVIAAAVIGGVSLSGGRGSVSGAVIGALVIQSLDSGMVLVGASSSVRTIAIGLILTLAVFADQTLSRDRQE